MKPFSTITMIDIFGELHIFSLDNVFHNADHVQRLRVDQCTHKLL